jgi:NAD-dependent aldehyde dehydrogenases
MNDYEEILRKQQTFFATGKTKSLSYRFQQLKQLKQAIKEFEPQITEALQQDLNKSELEAYSTEIGIIYEEINHALKHLSRWSKPIRVKTPITHIGSKGFIYHEPYGVALIISPWNYPFQLAIAPLIGAISAGNCAVLKPSELSPHVSRVMGEMIRKNFSSEYLTVVEGGVEASTELLGQKFDTIFFTGGVGVGKIVMQAAAKFLTPVTLELGGKSPCIVHKDARLDLAAKRVTWGKFLNSGQTCIAPDYLVVHKEIKLEFMERIKFYTQKFYGKESVKTGKLTAIVNDHHFQRLLSYLYSTEDTRILIGGQFDEKKRFLEPTIIDLDDWNHPVMQGEIFGPILPVLDYEDITDVIKMVNQHEKPLALYLFSESLALQKQVVQGISYGGGCVNDTVMHIATPYLPFGGVGSSGWGAYHGQQSFEVFSHKKSVLCQTTRFDLPMRYPDTKHALKMMKFFLK